MVPGVGWLRHRKSSTDTDASSYPVRVCVLRQCFRVLELKTVEGQCPSNQSVSGGHQNASVLSHLLLWPRGSTEVPGGGLILPQRGGFFRRATVTLIQSSCARCPHGPAGNNPRGDRTAQGSRGRAGGGPPSQACCPESLGTGAGGVLPPPLMGQMAAGRKGCLFSSQSRNSQKIDSPSLTMHTK